MTLIAFLVALGILVSLHELGHYLAARIFGVRVVRFSIGFGKPIVRYQRTPTSTEWVLAWIPLGGYVRMADQRDPESLLVAQLDPNSIFNIKPVWQRMCIVAAGPVMNLLLACIFYAYLQMQPRIEPVTLVSQPIAGSIAEYSGLQRADRIVAVNGETTERWSEVNWEFLRALLSRNTIDIEVSRAGIHRFLSIDPQQHNWPSFTPSAAAAFGVLPFEQNIKITRIQDASVAEQAGFQVGDTVLALEQKVVESSAQLSQWVKDNPGKELVFSILRDNQRMQIVASPEAVSQAQGADPSVVGRLGVGLAGELETSEFENSFAQAIFAGMEQTFDMSFFSLSAFWQMMTGNLSWKMLGGPIAIADAAGESAKLGFSAYIGFLAMLSVSLGVLNLLPIPVLDGGHLLYYLVEVVRGKPLSERFQLKAQQVGFVFLGFLTFFALLNDVTRFFF
jgi:regulator of sigma E protease